MLISLDSPATLVRYIEPRRPPGYCGAWSVIRQYGRSSDRPSSPAAANERRRSPLDGRRTDWVITPRAPARLTVIAVCPLDPVVGGRPCRDAPPRGTAPVMAPLPGTRPSRGAARSRTPC